MDAEGAAPAEQALAQGEGDARGLVDGAAADDDILQIQPGRAPGLPHEGEEAVEVALREGGGHGIDTAVVVVDMDRPQQGAVAGLFAHLGKTRVEFLLRHLAQHLFAEHGADGPELRGDGRVLAGEARVVGLDVDHAQAVAGGGEVEVHGRDDGGGGVFKVDGDDAAPGGGHLIHEAAGLAEEDVLRLLPHDREVGSVEAVAAEQRVEHRADQDLEGRRGGQAAALGHVGADAGVEAADRKAPSGALGAHAAHQRGGGPLLVFHGLELIQAELHHRIPLGLDAHDVAAV